MGWCKGLKKKIVVLLLCVFWLLSAVIPAWGQELETEAASAILMDANSGKILFAKDPNTPRPPASMTKIMTLLLAVEGLETGKVYLQDQVLISENTRNIVGTQVWLEPGEVWPLEQLLIAIAVASANDACIAVAEHIAGSEQKFVEMMNQRAREIGMKDTNFVNSHGLPVENHYMSAYDTAILCRTALNYPKLLEFTSIYEYPQFRPDPRPLDLWNTNKLLVWYDGVDGFKTGWTEEAGYCLAATAKRDGLRLISVVMNCQAANGHFSETIELFQHGFANYISERVISRGQVFELLPVNKGKEQEVPIMAATDLYITLRKGQIEFETKVNLDCDALTAPVEAGYKCGEAQIWQEGNMIGKVDLVTAASVAKSNPILNSWYLFRNWFRFSR